MRFFPLGKVIIMNDIAQQIRQYRNWKALDPIKLAARLGLPVAASISLQLSSAIIPVLPDKPVAAMNRIEKPRRPDA